MLVEMAEVEIIGRKGELDRTLACLHRLGLVELVDVRDEPRVGVAALPRGEELARRRDALRLLAARLDGMLALAAGAAPVAEPEAITSPSITGLGNELDRLAAPVEALTGQLESVQTEEVVLSRYIELLRRLLELMPELEKLEERELIAVKLETIALVLNTEDVRVVDFLGHELGELLGDRFSLVSAPVGENALGCVLLFPRDASDAVHSLLGQERVRHVPLPEAYAGLSLRASVEAMEARLGELPRERDETQAELDALLAPRVSGWRVSRRALAAELEQVEAVSLAGATDRVYVVVGWTPRSEIPRLREELARELGKELAVEEVVGDGRRDDNAPVLMRNPTPARPFEFVVRFLDTPRARSVDPTGLVALFLPLMFGLMVGDVVYGALLLGTALLVRRRFGRHSAVVDDASRILAVGSGWAIVFGVIFGEALGNLGEQLGMPAVWLHRDDPDALQPLLLLALAIGAAHVVLGLALGIWQSWRDRATRSLADRTGTLLFLGGLFVIAGIAADRLPAGTLTPAVAAIVVGLVLVTVVHGALGLMLGPLELLGAFGNVLSYLRLAAVGLASVYLAVVANELAVIGPIWMGVIIAAFLHALNLALAGFTPAIQALRLHYVEFFGKFYLGGGREFHPFGAPDTASNVNP